MIRWAFVFLVLTIIMIIIGVASFTPPEVASAAQVVSIMFMLCFCGVVILFKDN